MKKIVVIGRGGTGKTSFVALTTKFLVDRGETSVLLVDADPDQNLAEVIGVDLHDEGVKTISELISATFIDSGGTLVGVPPSQRMEGRIWAEGLYEGESFDLMAVGTKWVEGCYCLPNTALKSALDTLIKNYRYIIIDSPAGLEHLNRRITSKVEDVYDVIDSSKKAFEHVKRAQKIAQEVGIEYENFYVVGGYRFPTHLESKAKNRIQPRYVGKISYDKNVENYIMNGRSLLELPSDSPAYNSVKNILEDTTAIN